MRVLVVSFWRGTLAPVSTVAGVETYPSHHSTQCGGLPDSFETGTLFRPLLAIPAPRDMYMYVPERNVGGTHQLMPVTDKACTVSCTDTLLQMPMEISS
jgi:hypothetical protein